MRVSSCTTSNSRSQYVNTAVGGQFRERLASSVTTIAHIEWLLLLLLLLLHGNSLSILFHLELFQVGRRRWLVVVVLRLRPRMLPHDAVGGHDHSPRTQPAGVQSLLCGRAAECRPAACRQRLLVLVASHVVDIFRASSSSSSSFYSAAMMIRTTCTCTCDMSSRNSLCCSLTNGTRSILLCSWTRIVIAIAILSSNIRRNRDAAIDCCCSGCYAHSAILLHSRTSHHRSIV
mmetsp:Transcript_13391/g.22323  ORF Transcript_13391/g.22323 Transcript_13391/m.22323 type:complete len:232 (-) Transcript_13391:2113-2808(-)